MRLTEGLPHAEVALGDDGYFHLHRHCIFKEESFTTKSSDGFDAPVRTVTVFMLIKKSMIAMFLIPNSFDVEILRFCIQY